MTLIQHLRFGAVHAALGRLRRLLLYENLVLSLTGGAIGLILAYAGVDEPVEALRFD